MTRIALAVVAVLACGAPLGAQQPTGAGAPCADAGALLTANERQYCFALAQAVEAAQPQLGILIAGGNPTIGSAAISGLRVGSLPPLAATVKLGAVQAHLPDVRRAATASTQRLSVPAPALSASLALSLFPGVVLAPGVAGFGAVDALATASWLPFNLVEVRGLASDASAFAYGVGARVGLLRESFQVPAVSLSLLYYRLGRVRYGDVCPGGAGTDLITLPDRGYDLVAGVCTAGGDDGEFSTDLGDWSARAAVSKHLAGFGVAGGVGYDRFRSRIDLGLAASPNLPGAGVQPVYIRASDLLVRQNRWSMFANASYTFLITAVAAEVGWMQGGRALTGFDAAASAFDPRRGSWFASLGARISL